MRKERGERLAMKWVQEVQWMQEMQSLQWRDYLKLELTDFHSSTLLQRCLVTTGKSVAWKCAENGEDAGIESFRKRERSRNGEKLQWNQWVRQNSAELSGTQFDVEQENARTCEAEELQNLQRTESQRTSEPQNFTIAKANRKLKIPFHIQSANPLHNL